MMEFILRKIMRKETIDNVQQFNNQLSKEENSQLYIKIVKSGATLSNDVSEYFINSVDHKIVYNEINTKDYDFIQYSNPLQVAPWLERYVQATNIDIKDFWYNKLVVSIICKIDREEELEFINQLISKQLFHFNEFIRCKYGNIRVGTYLFLKLAHLEDHRRTVQQIMEILKRSGFIANNQNIYQTILTTPMMRYDVLVDNLEIYKIAHSLGYPTDSTWIPDSNNLNLWKYLIEHKIIIIDENNFIGYGISDINLMNYLLTLVDINKLNTCKFVNRKIVEHLLKLGAKPYLSSDNVKITGHLKILMPQYFAWKYYNILLNSNKLPKDLCNVIGEFMFEPISKHRLTKRKKDMGVMIKMPQPPMTSEFVSS